MKFCCKCGITYTFMHFYPRGNGRGYQSWCKGCYKEYRTRPDIKAKKAENRRAYEAKNPLAYRAHTLTNCAIKRGDLVRGPCEVCGKPNGQAHHTDYNKPLDVMWLCAKHHKELHRKEKEDAYTNERSAEAGDTARSDETREVLRGRD